MKNRCLIFAAVAVFVTCFFVSTPNLAQAQGTAVARALILRDSFGHTVKIIPPVGLEPGEWIYEIPVGRKAEKTNKDLYGSPSSGGDVKVNNGIGDAVSVGPNGMIHIPGSQTVQAAAEDNLPYITFAGANNSLTNNRVINDGNGISIAIGNNDNSNVTISNTGVLSLQGTNNRISVSNSTGNITLNLPQNIHTGATPEFANIELSNLSNSNSSNLVVQMNNGRLATRQLSTLGIADASAPYLTFGNGGSSLSNNRVLDAGSGIAFDNEGEDNGDFVIRNTGVLSLQGTNNRISVSNSTGNITLNLPQNIHTGATPEFRNVELTNLSSSNSATDLVVQLSNGTLATRPLSSVNIASSQPIVTFGTGGSSLSNNRVITAGTGININIESGDNNDIILSNTGVLQNIAGSGISVSSATGNVTLTNTGVRSAAAGNGISVSAATGDITLTNTGVLSAAAGNGIAINNSTGNVTIENNGVLSVAGTANQISVSGTTGNVTISLPQDIHTEAMPVFAGMALTMMNNASDAAQIVVSNAGTLESRSLSSLGLASQSEPIITFDADAGTLTNNRVLAAGTGISFSNNDVDNGSLTIENTGVTEVSLSLPSIFNISSPTVTTTGTLAAELSEQTQRTFFAAPIDADGTPSFRAITSSDIENASWTLNGNDFAEGQFIGGKEGNTLPLDFRINGSTVLRLNENGSIQRTDNSDGCGFGATDMQGFHQEGDQAATALYSTISGGANNKASGVGSTVGGGGYDGSEFAGNAATGEATTIAGGHGNSNMVPYGFIGGGQYNLASGFAAVVAGGQFNTASDYGIAIVGGIQNSASGEISFLGGGAENNAYGIRSVLAGGMSNETNGEYSSLLGGFDNNAGGNYSAVGGGTNNDASAEYSTITGGAGASADKYGQLAHATGSFIERGDAQRSEFIVRSQTNDDTETTLFLDGSSQQMTMSDNTAWAFAAQITAFSFSGDAAAYEVKGLIKRVNGTTSFVGTPSITEVAEDDSTWTVSVLAENEDGALLLKVTGAEGETIRWVASVRTTETRLTFETEGESGEGSDE